MKTISITTDQYVKLFETFMTSHRRQFTEIKAYEMTIEAVRRASLLIPALAEAVRILDETLAASRSSELLRAKMQSQYDELLEKFRQLAAEAPTSEEVLKAFELLTKTKLPN